MSDTKLRTAQEMAQEITRLHEQHSSGLFEPILREWARKIINQTVYRTKGHDWSVNLKALFDDLGL